MKKLLAFALVLVMGLTVLVGCTGNNQQPTEPEVAGPATALEVLENVWNLYGEDDKFAVIGGNMENPVDGAPGAYDMAYAENLTFNLVIPAEELGNVTEAATMIHMMNANTFTAGVVKLADGVDVAAFAATMNNALKNNQWMCGFPDKMVISDLGGQYLLVAFGVNDAINPFEAKLAEAYPNATSLYSEAVAG